MLNSLDLKKELKLKKQKIKSNSSIGAVEVKPNIELVTDIKVVGVGGAGGSVINRMTTRKVRGVEFIAINTDAQALHHNQAASKIHIGKNVTRGLGAGMNPDLGRQAAEESQEELLTKLDKSDMVFITCGLGGGTGTGAAPVVAELARKVGALTVAVVTKPFVFEGSRRQEIAEKGFEELKNSVDAIISIPNDRLLQIIDNKTPLTEAFLVADEVLKQGVQGISEIITTHALINVDFNDFKTIMQNTGSALMGVGFSKNENRAAEAAKAAVDSPLLELSIDGATGILFVVAGGSELALHEINEAAQVITKAADPQANIKFGAIIDESLEDQVKVTVVATGFSAEGVTREAVPVPDPEVEATSPVVDIDPYHPPSMDTNAVTKDGENDSLNEFDTPAIWRQKRGSNPPADTGNNQSDSSYSGMPDFIRKRLE